VWYAVSVVTLATSRGAVSVVVFLWAVVGLVQRFGTQIDVVARNVPGRTAGLRDAGWIETFS
jgi:hypothetical protein